MLQLKTLTLSDLDHNADRWDDLWQRSDVRLPTTRAAGVRLWCESFAPDAEFAGLVIEHDERLVAALPLVADRAFSGCKIYRLPNNFTVSSGDLMVDPECDVRRAISLLVNQIIQLPASLAAFENIAIEAERWQEFMAAFAEAGREMHVSPGHDVGVIDILHDWDGYQQSLSRNLRRSLKRASKKLDAAGSVEVERLTNPNDEDLQQILDECFAIEDAGWKGQNGTSIVQTPGLRDYYRREAQMLRDLGMFDLWILRLDDKIIAFDYSQLSKRTSFSQKISYDPAWAKYSPGAVLQQYQLERYNLDPSVALVDTLGVHCEVKARWTTRTYRSSRCYVALGGVLSNVLMRGAKAAYRIKQRMRRDDTEADVIEPGAAEYLESASARVVGTNMSVSAPCPMPIPSSPTPTA